MEMNDHQKVVEAFCKECAQARAIYDQYSKLFENGQLRLKLLEKVANTFFFDLNTIMKDYILTQICKLTDPAKTSSKSNLTANYLIEYLPWSPDKKKELMRISLELDSFRKHIVDARNKILAHNDLTTFVDANTLGAFPEGEEKAFWDNLQDFVNIAYGHYFAVPYSLDIVHQYDADDLIIALKKSVDYDEYFADKLEVKHKRRNQMSFKDA